MGRAAVLLIAFVIASAALLGKVHLTSSTGPTSATTGASPATSSTTKLPATKVPTTPTTTTTTVPPSQVPVVVANGSNVNGAAGAISTELRAKGWQLLPAENATASVASSNVYYVSGAESSASAIAGILGIPPSSVQPFTSSVPVSAVGSAQVIVVIGPDIASSIGKTPSSSTTTSVATTTTTKAKAKSH